MNAKQIIERADYLMSVFVGIDELTDERDLDKSDMDLYLKWRKETKDYLAQYDLFAQEKP